MKNINYKPIIVDALILLVVSTAFVMVFNQVFKTLKKSGATNPVVTAINQNSLESVQDVIKKKGKELINQSDEFGRSPLMWASYANFYDAKETQKTDQDRVIIVEYLIENGAEINARDKDGWTPLLWASWSGLSGVTTKLLEKNADLKLTDVRGQNPLMVASLRAQSEIVQLLTQKGADKMTTDARGRKASDFAKEGLSQYPERAEAYQKIISIL